ncbi:hypothetical protein MRB53_000336 [Persea americana]|uniref:Uncharacterized protein n=1 Tax=Persea americana TaxID=3435 RepID=A0ACC2MPD8_PERAE|nr:hypothetical protein MRB53_000336 [Persea americana]
MSSIRGGLRRPSWGLILLVLTALAVSWLHVTTKTDLSTWEVTHTQTPHPPIQHQKTCSSFFLHGSAPKRKVVVSITDFGVVGDGKTSNAFHGAMEHLKGYGEKGGSQLNVPVGRLVTGSFNLTCNFTLYLEKGAVILGSKDPKEWSVIEPLPSYGRGREGEIGRVHISLIHGNGLDDVVITDSSSYVCIEECYIESGDHLVAVKSGWDQYGINLARPSSNITIRRVSGTTPTCSGVGIGSEMSGGISNMLVEDLHVWDAAAGL